MLYIKAIYPNEQKEMKLWNAVVKHKHKSAAAVAFLMLRNVAHTTKPTSYEIQCVTGNWICARLAKI